MNVETIKRVNKVIAQAIFLYENILEHQENVSQETVEERKADKVWISFLKSVSNLSRCKKILRRYRLLRFNLI